jgi:EAL domain-containing protein (putative c-di-GMP-specific phosphodiesterase class I)
MPRAAWREGLDNPSSRAPARAGLLLVDDDELLLAALARSLTQNGYRVTKAHSVASAIAAMAGASFDAIVSDVEMPGLSGFDLIKAVRGHDLDVPVLLLTGKPSVESAIAALESGALQYLIKPVDSAALCASVARAVTLHQLAVAKRRALELQGKFSGGPGDRAALELSFDNGLRTLWMAFQPIVDDGGRVAGYEALMRTREPGLPSPDAMIGAAERLGRVAEVGRSVRAAAARAFTSAPPGTLLFVNLHAGDLGDEALFSDEEPLAGLAHRVVLEITERASLDAVKDVPARITALRRRGFRIALDDLGAGYAGLTSFALLEPDLVKLDMSLVRDLHRSPVKQTVIESMTRLCHDLSIRVVAEGVEVQAECDCLRALSCDYYQGYLFARPAETFVTPPANRFAPHAPAPTPFPLP